MKLWIKAVALSLLLFTTLAARENPFKPVIDATVLPVTSNRVVQKPPFTQKVVQLPSDARVLTSVTIAYQALDGSIQKISVPIDRAIDWHRPILISQTSARSSSQRKRAKTKRSGTSIYRPLPFLALRFHAKHVDILTRDPKIRLFHVVDPFKIVIDFKRQARFLSRHKKIAQPPFVQVDVGNHQGYYRVVLTLDGPYRYTLTKTADGYRLRLR